LYKDDRTVRSIRRRRRNWRAAMYLDREEGIGLPNRPGARNAARDAVEAKATLDPDILRRWRQPETEPPSEEPEAVPGHKLPAVIQASPETDAPADKPRPRRIGRRRLALLGVLLAAAAIGGGWFGYRWWTVGRFMISTDDAYVRADNTTLAAKVPGYVANIFVADNSFVHAGDVIAVLDDGDYRLAAGSARHKVA